MNEIRNLKLQVTGVVHNKGVQEPCANRNLLLGAHRKLGKIRPVSIY